MRPPGTGDALEQRRKDALRMYDSGFDTLEVRDTLGCSRSSIYRWLDAREQEGDGSLCTAKSPGRPSKLTASQKLHLLQVLGDGALQQGYPNQLWTCRRIARLIERQFGVTYNVDYIGQLMRRLRWSTQIPEGRAAERDEEEIARWRAVRWPSIRSRAQDRGACIAFCDETGVQITPNRRCTWAPIGKTPIVVGKLSRSKVSVSGALVVEPTGQAVGLFSETRRSNYTQVGVVEFLEDLADVLPRRLTIIMDNATIHREEWMADFLDKHRDVVAEYLPSYAPEMNPMEYVWSAIKAALSNWGPASVDELDTGIQRELQRVAFSSVTLCGCVAAAELTMSHS